MFIGLGAMKAGTTWLHEYFRSHPQVFASPIKELNFFTSHLRNAEYPHIHNGFYRRYLEHAALQVTPGHESIYVEKLRNLADRVIMDYKPEAYCDFFRNRMNKEQCSIEISPSYADLSSEDFAFMQSLCAESRYIFIMRDPVERFISHVRFDKKLNPKLNLDQMKIRAMKKHSIHYRRSRYDTTVRNLENHVGPQSIHYMFYESMFCREAIADLCAFMDLEFYEPDLSHLSNINTVDLGALFTPQELEEVAANLSDTYNFCRERFGRSVPPQWSRPEC
jgi:hypothetical protein